MPKNQLCIPLLVVGLFCSTAYAQPHGKVIYESNINNTSQLFIINSDRSGKRQITNGNKDHDLPSVFRDRVVYRQIDTTNNQIASILISSINGGPVKTLIAHNKVCYPKWQPGGQWIAYENYIDSVAEIWVMDTNGHNNHRLVANGLNPCWSHNGKKVYFRRDYVIMVLDLETGKTERSTDQNPDQDMAKFPSLSPGGTYLAYTGYHKYKPGKFYVAVQELGKGKSKIIFEQCEMPAWTNDPNYLVCSYLAKGTGWQIALINVQTKKMTFLTSDNNGNTEPVWVGK